MRLSAADRFLRKSVRRNWVHFLGVQPNPHFLTGSFAGLAKVALIAEYPVNSATAQRSARRNAERSGPPRAALILTRQGSAENFTGVEPSELRQ